MPASETTQPLTEAERLALAQKAFGEFKAMCFWWCRPDLEVTAENLPLVIEGLRRDGGHAGWRLAAKLCP